MLPNSRTASLTQILRLDAVPQTYKSAWCEELDLLQGSKMLSTADQGPNSRTGGVGSRLKVLMLSLYSLKQHGRIVCP